MARKILLADDSVTAQNMGRKILTDAGYEVMTVNNGSAALKRVTEQKPDLIVLDIYMPGYSGLEVCQRLKDSRETSRIPVLLTVGKLEPFKPEDARRVAADAFIVKPFEASELLSALTRLEDRIVPQGEGSRFSANITGIDRFVGDPAAKRDASDAGEQGWKSRIRFPSKKAKKDEPEPEPDYATPTAFRDLRGGSAEKPAEREAVTEPRSEKQEPGLVPDIPGDITPDELDALSALVAKLDGPIPQAEEIAPIGDTIGSTGSVPEQKAEAAAASAVETVNPATPVSSAAEVPSQPEATAAAENKAGAIAAGAPAPSTATAAPDYTPGPIDRDDEPLFATAAMALEQGDMGAGASGSERSEPTPSITEASGSDRDCTHPQESSIASGQEDQAQKDHAEVEEMVAEAVAEEAIAEQAGEERAPTDEELAEALRLLTPVHDAASGQGAEQRAPSISEIPVVPQPTAHAGNGSRWTAVPVELSSEEMAVSLEAEMFRTLAPMTAAKQSAATVETPTMSDAQPNLSDGATVSEVTTGWEAVMPVVVAAGTPVDAATTNQAAVEKKEQTPISESPAQAPAQEAATVTFGSHVTADAGSESSETSSEVVPGHVAAITAASEKGEGATGDQQSMSKYARADQRKGSKSGWHQIHTAAPTAKAEVETAKPTEAEPQAEDSLKAMAAAAASDDASSVVAAADSNAIASIVDSVLADLRPRIVEEIAKKLAKK